MKGMDAGVAYHLVLPGKKILFQIISKRWNIFMNIVRAISSNWTNIITLQCFDCVCLTATKEKHFDKIRYFHRIWKISYD